MGCKIKIKKTASKRNSFLFSYTIEKTWHSYSLRNEKYSIMPREKMWFVHTQEERFVHTCTPRGKQSHTRTNIQL